MVTYEWWDGETMTVTDKEAELIDRFRSGDGVSLRGGVAMIYRGKQQQRWAKKQREKESGK